MELNKEQKEIFLDELLTNCDEDEIEHYTLEDEIEELLEMLSDDTKQLLRKINILTNKINSLRQAGKYLVDVLKENRLC